MKMSKRLLAVSTALLLGLGVAMAATRQEQKSPNKERTFVGEVTDSHCGAKHMGSAAQCTRACVEQHGAKYALAVRGKVYTLDPGDQAGQYAGERVRVKGTLEGDTIHVSSIEPVAQKKAGAKS